MAKADLRKAEIPIGSVVERVRTLCGLSLKEFADAIHRDERQVARWIKGTEHAQLAALTVDPRFLHALVIAIAEFAQSDAVRVETLITLRRRA